MSEKSGIRVDTPVMVVDKYTQGCLETSGMCGMVKMLHEKCGACIEIYVSRIFAPYFWYPLSILAVVEKTGLFGGMPYDKIELGLGGRGRQALYCNPISDGMLRSWLIDRTKAMPGQSLDLLIMNMPWLELNNMYMSSNDSVFKSWVEKYDTRPRRTRITAPYVESIAGEIAIKRPKIT
jgi:hypothetical protein